MRPLSEVAEFIKKNKHLPDIEPASEVQAEGLKVADMSTKMMQKIEELTLYIIQQAERINALEEENGLLTNSSE